MMFGKSGSRKSSESAKPPMSPVAKAGTPTKASASSTNRLAVAALGKQLSQLETVGKQLDQTIAWVREHARDSHISLVHDAPKEAAQLSRLRQKLEHAVKELSSLAGSSVSHEAQVVKEEEPKPKSGEGAVVPPRRGTQERELEETREERAANDGGTVIGSVSKILSDESAALSNARTKANDEHKRLTTQMKEIHDLEARNQDLRAEMARKDLRAIREEVK